MKIVIDTEELKENNLSANEYLLLYIYLKNNILNTTNEEEINSLEKKGFLNEKLFPTNLAKQLFRKPDDLWEEKFIEFWKLYPAQAGSRILKTVSSSSHQAENCRKRFRKSCYDDISNADKLIVGLKKQLAKLKGTRDFDYFQLVETWLNQGTWEKYLNIEVNENIERTESIN